MSSGITPRIVSETQLPKVWGTAGEGRWTIDIFHRPGVDHVYAILKAGRSGSYRLQMKFYPSEGWERVRFRAESLDRAFNVATSHVLNFRESQLPLRRPKGTA